MSQALSIAALSLVLVPLAATATAQDIQSYPNKPIRILVGFPPGGPADIAARIVAEGLQGKLKQSVIVENKTGAGGNIATQYVAKLPPDGYTILVATASYTVNPIMAKSAGYDPLKDLAPVSLIATQANALAVHSALPVSTVDELKAMSLRQSMSFATSGLGTSSDLSAKYLFNMLWKSDFTAVPYRGAGPAGLAVATGTPPVGFMTITGVLPLQQEGRVKILAIVDTKRNEALPNVPTLAELGYSELNPSWTAAFVPSNTPRPIVDLLNKTINELITSPEFKEKFKQQMMVVSDPMSPQQLYGYIKDEVASWSRIVQATGIARE